MIPIFLLQRNENRLASLDPLVLQEFEFLKNFVARVVSLRPNILLVEKSVSRLAQNMLLQHGITLVLNVKPVSTYNTYKYIRVSDLTVTCDQAFFFWRNARVGGLENSVKPD